MGTVSHDYHEKLDGFSPDQILIDHCGECESRSVRADHGISSLDVHNFARAVERARAWNTHGLADISDAEVPLLTTLWSVWLQFERGAGMAFAFADAEFQS